MHAPPTLLALWSFDAARERTYEPKRAIGTASDAVVALAVAHAPVHVVRVARRAQGRRGGEAGKQLGRR